MNKVITQTVTVLLAMGCRAEEKESASEMGNTPPQENVENDTEVDIGDTSTEDTNTEASDEENDEAPTLEDVPVTTIGEGCTEAGGEMGTTTGPIVCSGEDWWLPSTIERSSQGFILTGWSYPRDDSGWFAPMHNMTKGQGLITYWANLEPYPIDSEPTDAGAAFNDGAYDGFLGALYLHNEKACWESCTVPADCISNGPSPWVAFGYTSGADICTVEDYEGRPMYYSLFGSFNGSFAPYWVQNTLPSMVDDFAEWCEQQEWCALQQNLQGKYSFAGSDNRGAVVDSLLTHWQNDTVYTTASIFWSDEFLQAKKGFLSRMAYMANTLDRYEVIQILDITSEGGLLPQIIELGYRNYAELDVWADRTIADALDINFPPEKWMVNINTGGRVFRNLTEGAATNGMGIGTHGVSGMLSHQFIQHLPYLTYRPRLQSYVRNGPTPYSQVHSDLEVFHKGEVLPQYRQFRLAAVADIALGATSLLVSAPSIPSQGHYQTEVGCDEDPDGNQWCKFDWDLIKEWKGDILLEWMNKNIGRSAGQAPEAYCMLVSYGAEIPEGVDINDALAEKYNQEDWGEEDGKWSEAWLRSPPISHFGHHCTMLPEGNYPPGEKALQMTEARIGSANPPLNNWVFGGEFPYEARSTRGTQNGLLRFRLREQFVSESSQFVIKLVFAALPDQQSDGLFRLRYRTSAGWAHTEPVHFDDSYQPEALQTVTFQIDDAAFSGTPGEPDIAIQHLDGAHAAFLMVRIIRSDRQ